MKLETEIQALMVLEKRIKSDAARVKEAIAYKKALWAEDKEVNTTLPSNLNGEAMGTVKLEKGATSWKVSDMKALVEWAVSHNPQIVSFEPSISPDSLKVLLRNPVTEDGEILPGVYEDEGPVKVVVRKARGSDPDAMIQAAVEEGTLNFEDLLAIESAGGGE